MISAKVICDSIGENAPRLTTFLTISPRFVHAEVLRHRLMSFSVSSSRAIPIRHKIAEARDDALRAEPLYWGCEKKGMSPGAALGGDDLNTAKQLWRDAALYAADTAEKMAATGTHKSIINRLLDTYTHCHCLITCAEPGLQNYFGLRLAPDAEPTLRELARAMWSAWSESEPRKLAPGEWHLPYISPDEGLDTSFALKVSAARCARVSHLSFATGKRSTVDEDLALFDKLVGAQPIHASPCEHPATPDDQYRPELWGNLQGWVQFRKTLPGESVAPLPESYKSRGSEDARFSREVAQEVSRARRKFPSSNLSLAALCEETGELAQCLLQSQPPARIFAEATQCAAMAQRIAVEGDPSFKS
jgi:Thymidylate synthase complementing protein